jgi:predicted HTH domain antitoxin
MLFLGIHNRRVFLNSLKLDKHHTGTNDGVGKISELLGRFLTSFQKELVRNLIPFRDSYTLGSGVL